jgi:hypothetical protein
MELLLYAAAFYAWQCLVHLPLAGVAWFPLHPFGWTRAAGLGWRALSPWPGARCWVSSGFAFELTPAAVWLQATAPFGGAERKLPLDAASELEVRGARLVWNGAELFRAALEAEARSLAATFVRLGAAGERQRAREIESFLARALSTDACRTAWREARSATRLLRLGCDAEFVLAFGVAGALAWPFGQNAAWIAILPVLAAAHVAALLGLWLAERRLATPRADRMQRLVVGALFPPALLRLPCELVAARLAVFHPATLAVVSLPRARAERVLRAALGAAAHPYWRRRGRSEGEDLAARDAYAARLHSGLAALAAEVGLAPDAIRPPALPPDAAGPSCCPVCLDEYRPGFRACGECGVDTVAPPAASGSVPRNAKPPPGNANRAGAASHASNFDA